MYDICAEITNCFTYVLILMHLISFTLHSPMMYNSCMPYVTEWGYILFLVGECKFHMQHDELTLYFRQFKDCERGKEVEFPEEFSKQQQWGIVMSKKIFQCSGYTIARPELVRFSWMVGSHSPLDISHPSFVTKYWTQKRLSNTSFWKVIGKLERDRSS